MRMSESWLAKHLQYTQNKGAIVQQMKCLRLTAAAFVIIYRQADQQQIL